MKKLPIFFLLVIIWVAGGCKKASSENKRPLTYIAFFQIDSLNNFLKPSSSVDTTRIRMKLKDYALKILKEKSISENNFVTTLYSTPTNNGFILIEPGEAKINSLRLDKRIDTLIKSIPFKAF